MRDPNRIPVILDALRAYWEQHPDLRLGQIVVGAAREKSHRDAFYIEDAYVIDALQNTWHAQGPVPDGTDPRHDAARIPIVLGALDTYWSSIPDLRLGQILENAATGRLGGCFDLEDAELLDTLTFHSFGQ